MAPMKTDGNAIKLVKRKLIGKESASSYFIFINMSSTTGLVWTFLWGLIFPFVVWTYGEFIQI